MDRMKVTSGSKYEPVIGFSRALAAHDHVAVAATAPIMPDGAEPPEDAYRQTRRCLEIIVDALREAGATPADVVRTRCYLTAVEDWEAVGRAHGEVFGEARPASSMI
ncbi:MAG TPA: Rid family hydrolase, partial [Actinomycetota bacterium]|nr:Rid family hydrolase [Actinomycetota bacterium]